MSSKQANFLTVLDSYPLDQGDIDWNSIENLLKTHGLKLRLHKKTSESNLLKNAKNSMGLLTNKVSLSAKSLKNLPHLKYIGILATGHNVVHLPTAQAQNIAVTNIPNYSTPSVAQCVFAHVLEHTHGVGKQTESVKQNEWSRCGAFSNPKGSLLELENLTFGIIGLGKIGDKVAQIALAFGMRVLVYTPSKHRKIASVTIVEKDSVLKNSDVVSLHCPLNEKTKKMANASFFKKMKKSALFINTARGGLVDEAALLNALCKKQIAGAGLDVLSEEPPPENHPFFKLSNVTLTPHIAWASQKARRRLQEVCKLNIEGFLKNKKINRID